MRGLASLNATTNSGGSDFDNAYWLGAAFTMDLFDPFVLKADLNYGKVESGLKQNERSGWLFDAALEYKGLDFMTPEVFFVYTTGEDGNGTKDGGDSERMPILLLRTGPLVPSSSVATPCLTVPSTIVKTPSVSGLSA